MFESVPRRGSLDPRSLPAVASPAEEDDDSISLTSTLPDQHDPEEEFEVKDVHMEIWPDGGGKPSYLIQWVGYPLHHCTWEPADNLGPELLNTWEEKKARQQRGEVEAWTVAKWNAIEQAAADEEQERHRRRNTRRRKLGLPLTEPFDESSTNASLDRGSSSDEAEESRPLAELAAERRRRSQAQHRPAAAKSERYPKPQKENSRDSNLPRPDSARNLSKDPGQSSRQERIYTTGYQGTARKSSFPGQGTSFDRGILSNSARPAHSKLTARSTVQVPAAVNVFAGGTMRKARTGLKDKMSDPTQEPKLFTHHRIRHLAEKHSRDMEDRPPPAITPNLFADLNPRKKGGASEPSSATSEKKQPLPAAATSDEPLRRMSTATGPASATAEAPNYLPSPTTGPSTLPKKPPVPVPSISPWDAAKRPPVPATSTSTGDSSPRPPEPTAPHSPWDSALQRKPKKKKSVRFRDDESPMFVDEPTLMDVDGVSEERPNLIPTPNIPTSVAQGVFQPQPNPVFKAGIPTRIVQTKLQFGFAQDSEPILASVDGVPVTSEDPWLFEFLKTDILRLDYTCVASDFSFQRHNIWQYPLCSGKVASGPSSPVLETVSEYLRVGTLALCQTTPTYSLIVYPGNSEEWRSLLAELGVPPSNEAGNGLRYCIFRSVYDCTPWLRHGPAKVLENNLNSNEEKILWRLFKFDYQSLLPAFNADGKKPPIHHFFLLFPRNRSEWLEALARWIRLSSPDCRVYTCYDSGSWSAFCDATRLSSNPGDPGALGVVIVHELLSLSLRRLPELSDRLSRSRDSFWCLSEAIQPQPVFPSLTPADEVVPPGEIRLVPLLPTRPKRRIAIFLTPSFLASESQKAFELLKWFHDVWAVRRSPTVRLITAYNLPEYLWEVAVQKSRERDEILNQYRNNLTQAEIAANVKGLSLCDCECRFKAWEIASQLHHLRHTEAGPYAVNEEFSPLQYADPSLDPNDEQSLVNWFGWWTTMRLDQFRNFHVVGSSTTSKNRGPQRRSCTIAIPKYTPNTVNDPDVVQKTLDSLHKPADAPNDAGEAALQKPATSVTPGRPPLAPSSRPWVFKSNHIPFESAQCFTKELDAMPRHEFVVLNRFPVSWTDKGMSVHFGDITEKYTSIIRWWKFAWPFSPSRPYNTYLALFYTVVDDWDPSAPPANKSPVRHPWICAYRSKQGHRHPPVGPCELIIWDPVARDKFPDSGREIREEDLAYGQRRVIDFVRNKTNEKNPGSYIEQVYYGGFQHPHNTKSPYPIDMTLAQIDLIVTNPFKDLPIRIQGAGYRQVRMAHTGEGGSPRPPSAAPEPMDIDNPEPDAGEEVDRDSNTRIIFHPPRGKRLPPGQPTRCINHMYAKASAATNQAARDGRRGGPRTMQYEFPVTTEWYDVQRQEDRGFEYMHVLPWEQAFEYLHVQPLPASAGGEGAARRSSSPNAGPENLRRFSSSVGFDRRPDKII